MIGSLERRGPDDHGVWTDADAGVHLGFRRLSIVDLSAAGHQPMISASGRFVVTFNGEIYNYRDLRERLGSEVRYRGHSDTEVLLAAVERWGVPATLAQLRGMFAIALWDGQERRLWLIRDRMGIKPLYVLHTPRGLAFASEARAFHACPFFEGSADPDVARAFLRRLFVPGRASILRGVERVAPGEFLCFDVRDGRVRQTAQESYWDLAAIASDGTPSITDPAEAMEAFETVFREAVRLRLHADVPLGAFLSGGIDSTAVVGMMQELSAEPVRTFTVGFDQDGFDESEIAADVARRVGTNHTRVFVPPEELLQLVTDLPRISDEPMANPSIIPTVMVSRVARRDVTVALSGDGGDECFGGYNRYLRGERLIRMRSHVPASARYALANVLGTASHLRPALALSRAVGGQQSLVERAQKAARLLGAASDAAAYETLLDVGWLSGSRGDGPQSRASRSLTAAAPASMLSRMMLYDQLEYLPDDLLTKVDRATMWESLEARVPLLDHEVVRFSWSLDPSLKIRDGKTKWPIRQIAARYVSEAVLDRPKMGFTVPIAGWLKGELKDWARDTLADAGRGPAGLFDACELERAWSRFQAGHEELALGLWAVVVLQAWSTEWGVPLEG